MDKSTGAWLVSAVHGTRSAASTNYFGFFLHFHIFHYIEVCVNGNVQLASAQKAVIIIWSLGRKLSDEHMIYE